MVMKERDEELALFLEMRRREKEKSNLLLPLNSSDEQNNHLGTNGGGSPISKIVSSVPIRKTAAENFLNSENENDKSDYDWLLTPPGTPLFPSLEMESQRAKMSQMEMPNVRPTALKSRLANIQEEPASKSNVVSRNPTLQSGANSSIPGDRRQPSSGGRSSSARAATPTGRPTLTTTAKSSRPSTPTSRSTLPSSKPAGPAVRSSTPTRSTGRSSTPTARPTVTAPKPAPRSATPTSKSTVRSATPTSRPTARAATPTSRPMVRSSTPTRQPSAPSGQPSVSAAAGRSSSVSKSGSTTLKNSVPSRGTSPTVKSRPWKPSEMPGFSLDAPPNLRTSLPERPASASRGRPGAPSVQSPSDSSSNGRRRQQSCSPSRGRTSNSSAYGYGNSISSSRSRANASDADDVNPVVIGTKMVERVVNMRKLAPPKQDNHSHKNSAGKSSPSLDSLGFGRTLSKKSLDMALRHMDIRRSIAGNLRPLMTNIPASSMYSVRSGSSKSRTVSVTDSPLATSSNASSEPSVNNNSFILDGSEIEDNHDFGSERGNSSPISQHGR
ncbi:mucin-5AC-like isoform X1 [Melia azedarach]|uniref:Mucin-5AC-like isoform X1 n=2 Tax=Melia azedarach TaxID=155640 RepID=A0ACC1WZI6_MELAZ|nr:mucin-5AC-like isoform X1 [Melia azedarach]KAJ4704455.1 mucin-5AC-like isoform X1 [Melia azedarach]